MNADRLNAMRTFYELTDDLETRLGGARVLSDCSGRDEWPSRGVYFFRESDEKRSDTGSGLRVVRVGTHALKSGSSTKLWTRLSQHKGVARTGGGNHRGSIFRLIVGTALIHRDGLNFPTWGKGSFAPREIREREIELERAVSAEIGQMSFLWLRIEDKPGPESLRGYIERNSIALLSNSGREPLDPPTMGWFGHYCNRKLVRESGLWNSNHVTECYDPAFLSTLKRLVAKVKKH